MNKIFNQINLKIQKIILYLFTNFMNEKIKKKIIVIFSNKINSFPLSWKKRYLYHNAALLRKIYEFDKTLFRKAFLNNDINYAKTLLISYSKSNNYIENKIDLINFIATPGIIDQLLKKYIVVNIKKWTALHHNKYLKCKNSEKITLEYPKILNESYTEKNMTLSTPESFIAVLFDVCVGKNAQIYAVRDDKNYWISYEPQAHPKNFFVASYWKYFIHYDDENKELYTPISYPQEGIEEAILLDGRCSENYFHWMLECLSRLYLLSLHPDLIRKSVPLLVAENMPHQYYEALKAIAGSRKIITYKDDIIIKKLYVLSVPTKHYDDINVPFLISAATDFDYYKYLRDQFLKLYLSDNDAPNYPKKIFVGRKPKAARALANQVALENYLKKKNYAILYPENLSFVEQIKHFAHADTIIGLNGAALTNLLFIKNTAKVYILINRTNREFSWHYNLARYVADADVWHITCEPHGKIKKTNNEYEQKMLKVLQGYKVNLDDLKEIE